MQGEVEKDWRHLLTWVFLSSSNSPGPIRGPTEQWSHVVGALVKDGRSSGFSRCSLRELSKEVPSVSKRPEWMRRSRWLCNSGRASRI